MKLAVILVILVVLLALLLAAAVAMTARLSVAGGAARRPPSRDVVVDTLNLFHWANSTAGSPAQISTQALVDTIAKTAPVIRAKFPGRIMYVLKDRESALNEPATRQSYARAAADNQVFVYAVERYEEPPAGKRRGLRNRSSGSGSSAAMHSTLGRDDFYMGVLARRYHCPVLTEDRLRDFALLRGQVGPFHVFEYAFFRDRPERDYVDPSAAAYRTLKKPRTVRYADVGLAPFGVSESGSGGNATPRNATLTRRLGRR